MGNNPRQKKEQSWGWQLFILGAAFIFLPCATITAVNSLIGSQLINFLTFAMFGLMAVVGLGIGRYVIYGREALRFLWRAARSKNDSKPDEPVPPAYFVVFSSIAIALCVGLIIAWLNDQLSWSVSAISYGLIGLIFGLVLRYILRNDIID